MAPRPDAGPVRKFTKGSISKINTALTLAGKAALAHGRCCMVRRRRNRLHLLVRVGKGKTWFVVSLLLSCFLSVFLSCAVWITDAFEQLAKERFPLRNIQFGTVQDKTDFATRVRVGFIRHAAPLDFVQRVLVRIASAWISL